MTKTRESGSRPEAVLDRSMLDGEWLRVSQLLSIAEAVRSGTDLPEDFGDRFGLLANAVSTCRAEGAWSGLASLLSEETLAQLVHLDLDILAIALAAEAQPSLAPRIQSLQPQLGVPHPSLALMQELLMLDLGNEVDSLFERLKPSAPLAAYDLVRVSGEGAYQTVRGAPSTARAVLGRSADLGAPPGTHLVVRRCAWDDLVLPRASLRSLRDFVAWIKHRDQVISSWGARELFGPLALFSGPSGSGKTYAASVITAELERATGEPWVLYALDLGRIMSKYVGETEKNLNALLDALDGRRAVLQIDEADGLLGKRGEVSDARDRYANLEVSHLLSRFERHIGPVILTTNLRSNVDTAFLRRFQMIVDFPAPDEEARTQLWSALLPEGAPRDELDVERLASAARLSGGAIHNAAFYASVLASEEATPISTRHIARAVWAELKKDQRPVRKSELGSLAVHLEEAR